MIFIIITIITLCFCCQKLKQSTETYQTINNFLANPYEIDLNTCIMKKRQITKKISNREKMNSLKKKEYDCFSREKKRNKNVFYLRFNFDF